MSRQHSLRTTSELKNAAPVFAALGDKTRLGIITQLCRGGIASITRLTIGSGITRQALTKHLHILAKAGLVRSVRAGRECCWELQPKKLLETQRSLDLISKQWDETLHRFRIFVENESS